MKWRDIFTSGKNILSALGDLTDNEDFKKNIGQAGGFFSLINVALEVTEQIREESLTEKEKAYNSLSKFVLRSTKEFFKDIKKRPAEDFQTTNIKDEINKLYQRVPDNRYSILDWNSNLTDHPLVKAFIEKIKVSLEDASYPEDQNSHVILELKRSIEDKIEGDKDYEIFFNWWKKQRGFKELVKYLEYIEALKKYRPISSQNKDRDLYEYYVEQKAIVAPVKEWIIGDTVASEKYSNKDIHSIIKDFIKENESHPLVIAAPFGMGKTSISRVISSNYARDFLDGRNDSQDYIPIPIFLDLQDNADEDLITAYNDYSLSYLLENIISPYEHLSNSRILLILDGLDEYDNRVATIGSKLRTLRQKYRNMKSIITTRPENEILKQQGIIDIIRDYVRILPFNKSQVDKFFEKYDVQIQGKQLTYNYASEMNLPIEEMSKPLFIWIFSFLETSGEPELKIESKRHWGRTMIKSWIYMLFFHHVIQGKYKDTIESWEESYISEKKILRRIAALKQIHEENLDWKTVEEDLKKFEIPINTFKPISYFLYLRATVDGKLINFVHRTFQDFLLAEYILESLLEDKIHRINIRRPTRQTIEFLHGLIKLLLEHDKYVERSIANDETSLLKSFNYNKGLNQAKEDLKKVALKCIEAENIIFFTAKDNVKEKEQTEIIWRRVDIASNDYEHSWIHRWISLYVLNSLDPAEKPDKIKLANLIRYSSTLVPSYIKNMAYDDLRGTNLTGVDLSNAYLEGTQLSEKNPVSKDNDKKILLETNLERANLSGAILEYAVVSHANLSGANLVSARLSHSNLSGANLTRTRLVAATFSGDYRKKTNLERANLSRANLSGAHLEYTNLSGAKLKYANLSGAILEHANLQQANLSGANLSGADLERANLSGANLSGANLSGAHLERANLLLVSILEAIFSYSQLTDVKAQLMDVKSNKQLDRGYPKLICEGADFNNAIIYDKEILDYLKQQKATKLPDPINDNNELANKIKENTYDETRLVDLFNFVENN